MRIYIQIIFLFFLFAELSFATEIKVGLYENEPKLFTDKKTGKPSGFFIDIIEHIAKQNGWNLTYIPCTWQECLEKTKKGEIDIMPDVAYSKERGYDFRFGKEVVLANWSPLFSIKEVQINSLKDIEGKRVGVLAGSIQHEALKKIIMNEGFKLKVIEVESFDELFEDMEHGDIEVGITNRQYGDSHVRKSKNIVRSNVIINPSEIYFVAGKESSPDLLEQIDKELKLLKNSSDSLYYKALARWIEVDKGSLNYPFLLKMFGLFFLALFLILLWIKKLKKDISEKQAKEAELKRLLDELVSTQEALIRESRFSAMSELITDISHQWRQPLGVINLSLMELQELYEKHEISPTDFETKVAKIEAIVNALSDTINEVGGLFKKDEELSRILLSENIRHAEVLLQEELGQNGIELKLDIAKEVEILTYPSYFNRVLLSILKNSIDAIKNKHKKGGVILLSLKEASRNLAEITIEDNGGKLEEEIFKKLFEPFFTTKFKSQGVGLGLYLCRLIVKRKLKGAIQAENGKDGLLVRILLPF